jgi:arylsulfatase A-like enzyme/Flp pilus assembly protein TadD
MMARRKKEQGPSPSRRGRKVLAAALALLALAAAAVFALYFARERQPTGWNLVLVSVDTLRADHLSSYGANFLRTPHMDRLASEGLLYENVSTVAPTTLPSHASLFTGLTPVAHGVRDNVGFYLDDRFTTLAAHLKKQGYDTAAFVGAFVLDSRFGLDRGFDLYDDHVEDAANERVSGFVAQRRGAEVLESALGWLGSRGDRPRPFFVFLHFYDPHTPYEPPAGEGYRGEVAYVDSLVGRLLSYLDERGLTGRTLVALTADHGESLGDHGELTHGLFLYQSTLRIPLLFRYPGASPGERISHPMHITGIASEILEILRLPPMPGGRPAEGRPLYAETFVPRLHYGWSELRSLTRWPHKLVMAPRPELYDLSKDPQETSNLFEEIPGVARALERELDLSSPIMPGNVDRETLARLESLGYAGSVVSTTGELPDPKDRLNVYRILNDPAIQSVRPEDGAAFERALTDLKEVLVREPGIPRTYALYGELLLEAGRAKEAAGVFESLVALDERSFDGHYGLGVALQNLGREDAAIAAFAKSVEIDPRNTKSCLRLSEAESARGNMDAAEGWLRRAIAVQEDPVLVNRLAQLLLQSGRGAEARRLLEGLAVETPDDGLAAYNLGQILLADGRTEEALRELKRAEALSPADPDVHQALGTALALSGRREEAIESFRRAIEISPCFAAAQANLGAAYAELGRLPEAAVALEKAVACDPDYAAAYKNLAAIRLQMGDLDRAVAAMKNALRASPSDPELQNGLRQLLDSQTRPDRR